MKCNDFEKLIYLHDEIGISDKSRLEEHLKTCASCSALFSSVRQTRDSLRTIRPSTQSEERNPFLVHKIMSSLKPQARISLLTRILEKFDHAPVRYALATISFGMIITFLLESGVQRSESVVPVASINQVKIDASLIHRRAADIFRTDKSSAKFAFLKCARICRGETGSECSDCVTRRLNQN